MKIISNKNKLNRVLKNVKNLGFVPTMGALHNGHVSLIKKSIKSNKNTIVSIYINKPQFNKKNDYNRYPKNLKKDLKILRKLKVDYLFIPTDKEMYPTGGSKNIKINSFKKKLCGKFRPGHFDAIIDVVNRFLKIIKPSKVYFGEKDMQQLILIKDHIYKNNINTKVISCKTVRQKNGIAYSSRNLFLNTENEIIASKIYKLLYQKKRDLIFKKISFASIKNKIFKIGVKRIDYLKILDVNKIIKPYQKSVKKKIFIAYYLNSIRLIDNI
jgi:pantoate--beta-alanine ligase